MSARDRLLDCGRAALQLLFPLRCLACRRELPYSARQPLCLACRERIVPFSGSGPEPCGPALERVRSFAALEGPLQLLIHQFKYLNKPWLAEPLALCIKEAWDRDPAFEDCQWIVPVPLYPARERERGYDQTLLLAQEFLRLVNAKRHPDARLELRTGLLTRRRNTRSQTRLTKSERRENMRDAFQAAPAAAGKTLLLIDDVRTTGATLEACAQALLAAGAARVLALTVARDLLKPSSFAE